MPAFATGYTMAVYDAFISYSHSKDKPIAAALQAAIQKLGKPWYQRRALRLFRDDTSLSATPHLWPTIEQALGQSRFFLLIASPEAATSKWVNKEVAYWLEHNSVETLLIGLTDGELSWDELTGDLCASGDKAVPLPPVLAKAFPSEPKWVDLRPYRAGAERAARKRDAKFTELAADFAAAIRGVPKEDLLSQEVRQQRRALTLACCAAVSLLVFAAVATVAGILAYREEREAIAQRNRAEQTLSRATQTADVLAHDVEKFLLVDAWADDARAASSQGRDRNVIIRNVLDMARMLNQGMGDDLLAQGDLAGALKSYREGLTMMLQVTQLDPGNTEWQRDLSVIYAKLGEVYRRSNDLNSALNVLKQGQAIMERLTTLSPDDAEWKRELGLFNDQIAALSK